MIYSFTAEPAAYKLSLTLNFFNPEEIDLEAFIIVPVLRFCLDDDEALLFKYVSTPSILWKGRQKFRLVQWGIVVTTHR